jgi:hypothetical protein
VAESRPTFDPYGILETLDRHRATYIVIGGFARVIQGTEEITRGVDVVPSTRAESLRRLEAALRDMDGRVSGKPFALDENAILKQPVIEVTTKFGEVKVVPEPAGTRGYDDLRRAANREPLGRGVRPSVASIGDLARMLSARGRDEDFAELRQLRRLVERGRTRGIKR